MRDRVVLVTGATGFIGSALCPALADAGAIVHGLSRAGPAPNAVHTGWSCDASDFDALQRVVAEVRPDVVYHLAAHVSGARGLDAVLPTFRSKLQSTVNLLCATQELDACRIVLAGSLEEPDDASDAAPGSPYAAASWASGVYGRMFHALYDRPIVTARIFMAFGPGESNLERLVPYVIRSLLRGEAPDLTTGARPVDWIYIDDLVRGLMAVAMCDTVDGTRIDLGSGTLVTVRGVVERIAAQIGADVTPRFGALAERLRERVCVADTDATLRKTDWSAQVSLEDGLRRTIAFHREGQRG